MTTLLQNVKDYVTGSKSRLDFDAAISEGEELSDAVFRDGSLLDMQKRSAVAAIKTAMQVLESRYNSPSQMSEALANIGSGVSQLEEPMLGVVSQWFFHIAYTGNVISDRDLATARELVARRHPDPKVNERELNSSLDRYEWLAEHGPDPYLTKNNAQGAIVSSIVRPLSKEASSRLRTRAHHVFEIASRRSSLSIRALVRETLDYCSDVLSEASERHRADLQSFLAQTPSYCIRVSLSSIADRLDSDPELATEAESVDEALSSLRESLDQVGFRSSSSIFAAFNRRFDSFREQLQQSIDFSGLKEQLFALRDDINRAKKGRAGLSQLSAFHANQAAPILQGLFEDLQRKHASSEELSQRLAAIDAQVSLLEADPTQLRPSSIKRLQADLKRDAPLSVWIESFPGDTVAIAQRSRLDQFRERLRSLWDLAAAQETQREDTFATECTALATSISNTVQLPLLLPELLDLNRSLDEFSAGAQRRLRPTLQTAFGVFRERAHDTHLIKEHLEAVLEDIDRYHRRIRSDVDFEELARRVDLGRRWLALRDFPEAERSTMSRLVRRCIGESHRLRVRRERALAARAAAAFEELSDDIDAGVNDAVLHSGRQECWEELVSLDRRLREASRQLSEPQRTMLRQRLDEGFQKVRQARAAFAASSAQRFAFFNDMLGDIISRLEETPTRETALEAIECLKPLRISLREEHGLLRSHRNEIAGLLDQASQGIDEVFEKASAESKASVLRIVPEIERLEEHIERATNWDSTFALIASHKALSSIVRESRLSIADRRDLRLRLERSWEDISEKLQQFRFGRTTEAADSLIARLEQQGWLLFVREVPRVV